MPDDAPVTSAVELSLGIGSAMSEAYWSQTVVTLGAVRVAFITEG